MQPAGDILQWLNHECEELSRLKDGHIKVDVLRSMAVDDLRNAFQFPMEVVLRGYVSDVRLLKGPAATGVPEERYLEFIPSGFSETAYRVFGGIIFPCERRLEPGSVITATLEIRDPDTYDLKPPGILARLTRLTPHLAVEP